jgi:hypothetical protein
MIERVAGNKSLSQSIRQDIIARTDGIPLFVEEMTKAVLEAQGEDAAESTITTIPSPSIGVPASLHAPLMARLDRLGPAKEVAQIGAAVGFLLRTLAGRRAQAGPSFGWHRPPRRGRFALPAGCAAFKPGLEDLASDSSRKVDHDASHSAVTRHTRAD